MPQFRNLPIAIESLWHDAKDDGFAFDKLHLDVAPRSDDSYKEKWFTYQVCTVWLFNQHQQTLVIYQSRDDKNSSGDEIANVNFCTTTTYMERPAPTPIEPLLSTINIYGT